ncbi:hypothetical protein DYB30_002810, partial [Aphanomyces astaci]
MAAPLYKDVSKKATNVLNDDYDFSRKLKIKTKTANGVTFTTEGAMAANKSILAKLGASFVVPQIGGLTVSKLQVTTQGRVIVEADINNALVDNLKVTAKVEDGSRKTNASQVTKLGLEYKQPTYTLTKEFDVTANTASVSALAVVSGVTVGAHGAFNVNKSAVSDYGGALAYNGGDFQVTVATKKSLKTINANFHHQFDANTIYAASIDYDVQTAANALTLGGRYAVDKDTTYLGKVNSDGFVSLAVVQKVTPFLSLTTSAHIDAKHFEGDSHKFGLGLTIEIFASKRVQCAISLTGGGGNVSGEMLGTCGASSTLLEVSLPYYQQSLVEFLNLSPDVVQREVPTRFSFSSQEVSILMAKKSLERARALVPLDDAAKCEDECVGNLIVLALAKAARVDGASLQTALTVHELDTLTEHATEFDDSIPSSLMSTSSSSNSTTTTIALFPNNVILRDMPWKHMLVLPGSFNPVHQGHLEFALAAQRLLQSIDNKVVYTPLFELSLQNADKGALADVADLSRRVRALVDTHNQRVVLTNASLFVDKAALFPSCVFAVGADTAVRLVDLKYYGNDPAKLWLALATISSHKCRFVVAGRLVEGAFVSAQDAISRVPAPFEHLFVPIPESTFRLDLSSTQLRQ